MNISSAIFTFNIEAQAYGCDCSNTQSSANPNKLSYTPSDFVKKFVKHTITANNDLLPDIYIINLQESCVAVSKIDITRKNDELLHAFLDCVKSYDDNYIMIQDKLTGINSNGLIGIRTGLIISKSLRSNVEFHVYRPIFNSELSIAEGQHLGKGSILLDVKITKNNKYYHIVFINTHLPFSGKTPDQGMAARDQTVAETLKYFNSIIDEDDDNIVNRFIIGDLNYRISFGQDMAAQQAYIQAIKCHSMTLAELSQYKKYDQLQHALGGVLAGYCEGIDNAGPNFYPTCKLVKTTNIADREYQTIKRNAIRVPSWCDRILYTANIKCIMYDSFDSGNTCKSDHKPVVGLYHITSDETMAITLATSHLAASKHDVGGNINGIDYVKTRRNSAMGNIFTKRRKTIDIHPVVKKSANLMPANSISRNDSGNFAEYFKTPAKIVPDKIRRSSMCDYGCVGETRLQEILHKTQIRSNPRTRRPSLSFDNSDLDKVCMFNKNVCSDSPGKISRKNTASNVPHRLRSTGVPFTLFCTDQHDNIIALSPPPRK